VWGKPTFYGSYKPPAIDSARARATAVMFLTNCRDLPAVDFLAGQYRLKPKTAAYLLGQEKARREAINAL
jgi:hypothetical protein